MGTSALVIMVFLPAAAAVVVALLGSQRAAAVRGVSLAATLAALALAAVVTAEYVQITDPNAELPAGAPIQPKLLTEVEWLSFTLPAALAPTSEPARARIMLALGIDGISLWLVGLTALLMVTAVLVSWTAITERIAEFYAFLLVLETGLLGVFCAFDLILFYVFFEFTLIPLFFLIGIWGGAERRYAARKFFIYTLAGSLLSLVGLVALVLALHSQEPQTFTFSIPELARGIDRQMQLAEGPPADADEPLLDEAVRAERKRFWYDTQWVIFLLLFIGFAIKVPLPPFHTWLPLAHVEAPTAGSVLLAGVLLKLGTYGFLRLCLPLLPYASWNVGVPLVAALAVIGIIYGALCALAQDDIKRLVAYSSVSHLGFCMLGMFALNAEGMSGSVLAMVNHGLSTGALFLLVGMLYERYHTRQLGEMGGLAARLPLLAFFMVFISLSSLGLPGLNGFIGEVLSLLGMFKVHPAYVVVGATGIILGAWYLLSMLRRAFFGPLREPANGHGGAAHDLNGRELAALVPIAVLCVGIGVFPKPFLDPMQPELKALERIYQDPARLQPPGLTETTAETRP